MWYPHYMHFATTIHAHSHGTFSGSSQLLFGFLLLSQLSFFDFVRAFGTRFWRARLFLISRFKALASLWHCRLHSRIEAHHLSPEKSRVVRLCIE